MRLAGKVAGGASGIGAATARLFAVLDIAEAGTEALRCDVHNEAEVRAAMAEVAGRLGPIDILFNNAGAAADGGGARRGVVGPGGGHEPQSRVPVLEARDRAFCSGGRGDRAFIVGRAGIVGFGNRAAYTAAKAALVGLTKKKNMALDFAARGMRVNCVCVSADG